MKTSLNRSTLPRCHGREVSQDTELKPELHELKTLVIELEVSRINSSLHIHNSKLLSYRGQIMTNRICSVVSDSPRCIDETNELSGSYSSGTRHLFCLSYCIHNPAQTQ